MSYSVYFKPATIAPMQQQIHLSGCVVQKDGKYLLVQEIKPAIYGLWNLPAGHVEDGETNEQAAIREMKEETGYIVEIDKPITTYYGPVDLSAGHTFHVFAAHIVDGDLTTSNKQVLNAEWKSYNEIKAICEKGTARGPWLYDCISRVETEQ